MKKILFITGRLGGGGSERVLTILANALAEKGYSVSIISFSKFNNPYHNICKVDTIDKKNDLLQLLKLRKFIKDNNPDTVVAFEYYVGMKTVLASAGLNVKVIISERNDPHKIDNQRIKRWLRDYLYSKADLLVFQTPDARDYFSDIIRKKSVIIANPICNVLPTWNEENHKKIIVNFCKLEKQKNLPLLIEAFTKVRNDLTEYSLHIYGEGAEYNNLCNLIQNNKMEGKIKIFPFSNNIHSIVACCALFVSSSDFEGISNSMLEAMAIGIPVICTDCPIGGSKMIINNGINGLLVPTNNIDELSKTIVDLLNNPTKMRYLSNNARKVKVDYSINRILEQWEQVL